MLLNLKARNVDGKVHLVDPATGDAIFIIDAVGKTITVPAGVTFSTSGGSGSVTASQISDASANGRSLITAVNFAAMLTLLGIGSAGLLAVDTDSTMAADSDTRIPSQKAVKAAIALAVTGLFEFKSGQDCSGNPNFPAASKGDAYVVTVAGKIGGGSGVSVDVGDVYVASADNAGGTQASVGTSWFVLEHNLVGALLTANNLSDLTSTSTARTNLGLRSINTISYSSTPAIDLNNGPNHIITLAGNPTFSVSNDRDGDKFSVIVRQSSGGSNTVTWFSGILWAGGSIPTQTAGANKYDEYVFHRISSGVYLGAVALQNC